MDDIIKTEQMHNKAKTKKKKPIQKYIKFFIGVPKMQYGLNNNMGNANNTNKTQNSSFVNRAKEYGKKFRDGMILLKDIQSITKGNTGGERLKAITDLIQKYL